MLFLHRLYNCKKGGVQCRRQQSALLDIEWCIRHLQRFHIKQKRRRILPTHFFKMCLVAFHFASSLVWRKKERGKKAAYIRTIPCGHFYMPLFLVCTPQSLICYIYSEEKGKNWQKVLYLWIFFSDGEGRRSSKTHMMAKAC